MEVSGELRAAVAISHGRNLGYPLGVGLNRTRDQPVLRVWTVPGLTVLLFFLQAQDGIGLQTGPWPSLRGGWTPRAA